MYTNKPTYNDLFISAWISAIIAFNRKQYFALNATGLSAPQWAYAHIKNSYKFAFPSLLAENSQFG